MKIYILTLLVGFMTITGCSDKDQNSKPSLPTMGTLVIGVDESLQTVLDDEIKTFSIYYPNADITPLYLPEKQVVEKLLANEIQTGIICRDLYDHEIESIKTRYNHSLVSFKLAEDEIVFIVNNSNLAVDISQDELIKILAGDITNWKQIDPVLGIEAPIVVIMTASSSVDRYFTVMNSSTSPITGYALDSTNEVIDYVKNNISALGILGGSRFYQKGKKYKDIKLPGFKEDNSDGDNPKEGLRREIFAVTHEPFTGLGTGFISFLAEQKGQLIISKAGMIPYKPIERKVQLVDSMDD